MTDSQTALDLINIGLRRPEELRVNKHRDIVLQTAQMIAVWPREMHLRKIRAHVDMAGNVAADQLASEAHDPGRAQVFEAAGRGQHWIMYRPAAPAHGGAAADPEPWAVNNLKGHVQRLAEQAQRSGDGQPHSVCAEMSQAPDRG